MRFGLMRAAAVLLLIAGLLPATGAEARQFKRIRDVSVDCSDALICDVSTYNAQSELYTVIFRRRSSRDAPLELVLGVRETLAAGSEVVMQVDGREILRLPVSELSYRAAVYEYTCSRARPRSRRWSMRPGAGRNCGSRFARAAPIRCRPSRWRVLSPG